MTSPSREDMSPPEQTTQDVEAARPEQGSKTVEGATLTLPFSFKTWASTPVTSTDMLPACESQWMQGKPKQRGLLKGLETFDCFSGMQGDPLLLPLNTTVALDERDQITHVYLGGRVRSDQPEEKIEAMKRELLETLKDGHGCERVEIDAPDPISERLKQELPRTLTHMTCEGFDASIMYEVGKVFMVVYTSDDSFVQDYIQSMVEFYSKKP